MNLGKSSWADSSTVLVILQYQTRQNTTASDGDVYETLPVPAPPDCYYVEWKRKLNQ